MTFSDDLRATARGTWDAVCAHRFVDDLWAGRLDPSALSRYLVQDHQVQDAFLALRGAAVATADHPEPRLAHARRLGLVAGPLANHITRGLDALDVPMDDRTHPEPDPASAELVALVRGTAGYPQCLAVLLASDWLGRDAAHRPDAEPPADPLQREWLELRRGPSADSWVAFLRLEFDRVAAALAGADRDRLRALFSRTAELELARFDAARG